MTHRTREIQVYVIPDPIKPAQMDWKSMFNKMEIGDFYSETFYGLKQHTKRKERLVEICKSYSKQEKQFEIRTDFKRSQIMIIRLPNKQKQLL